MKVIVQRVNKASCKVDDKITGSIQNGFMLLVVIKILILFWYDIIIVVQIVDIRSYYEKH